MEEVMSFFDLSSEAEFFIFIGSLPGFILGFLFGVFLYFFFNYFSTRRLDTLLKTIERILFDNCAAVVIDKSDVMCDKAGDSHE